MNRIIYKTDEGGVELVVDNDAKIKHKALFIKSKDSLLIINAGDINAPFSVFYKV
jgi:hypothetical protein